MKKDFLLEINTEELPASYIKDALVNLCGDFHVELGNLGLQFDHTPIENLGTKDCLISYIKDIDLCQKEGRRQILGPPKRIAFDEKGNPTKQALGFAKNQGVRVEDLKIKKTLKGEYVIIEKKEKSRDTKDILKEITPRIVKNVHFPKTMRWDDSGLRFARPIESVLALFGEENLDIKLGDVPQKKIDPIAPAEYLKEHRGINFDARKKDIKTLILNAVKRLGADEIVDEDLLDEVNFMVNSPDVVIGEFNKRFLVLPEDVLKASMSKHQRVFPVSKKGKLINRFIAIIEEKKKIKLVRKNYEKILEAKLQDSLFFFNEDMKKPLSENTAQLKDLIFQKDLGNMFEKIERLKKLCSFICDKLGEGPLKSDTERAAILSKSDLTTHMVGEFPSLQGIMGGEYASRSNETKEASTAIKEQYLPQGAEDGLPKSKVGAILAVSDKLDNLVGFLWIGIDIKKIKISGSLDPFGIRRNAFGIIRIIKDKSLRLDIDELIKKTIELYGAKIKGDAVRFKNQVVDYIKDKIEFLMGDLRPIELKKAVLAAGDLDISDIFKRSSVLKSISNQRYFLEAAKVVERTSNILKGAKNEKIPEVNKGLFKEDLEQRVWKAYLDSKDNIHGLINKEKYREATKEYAQTFFKVLHEFFDKVMVNAQDRALRLNRLAMMKAINMLYVERVANLALLPQIVVK